MKACEYLGELKKVKRLGHGINYENRKQKHVLLNLTKKGEL